MKSKQTSSSLFLMQLSLNFLVILHTQHGFFLLGGPVLNLSIGRIKSQAWLILIDSIKMINKLLAQQNNHILKFKRRFQIQSPYQLNDNHNNNLHLLLQYTQKWIDLIPN
ncbi:hypothetical protein FGO68_gene5454 [Halteria grandinella]|uniref:Transmembrane protein n=1 Tax=Halteria grandinella TaxID=5974 RepID=A0A8J8ND25_HALGN|nr:hypothetical protein FGO68_gene5454 [Halteria grandinella]